jgi:hypothetical protein
VPGVQGGVPETALLRGKNHAENRAKSCKKSTEIERKLSKIGAKSIKNRAKSKKN